MVQVKGTRSESQRFRIDRAGKRKYSAPRLLSASGEEAARRAMPTRLAAGSGGDGVCRSVSRWGTGGKRGRESLALEGSSEPWKARRVALRPVRVAIARSPLCRLYSLFIRLSRSISPYLRYRVSLLSSAPPGAQPRTALPETDGYTHFFR